MQDHPVKKRLFYSFNLLIISTLILLSGCSSNKKPQPPANPAVPVTVGTVAQKAVPLQLTAIGNVQAYATVSVRSQISGQLLKVNFKEGDFVTKGQLLFEIDPREAQQALRQAQSDYAKGLATQRQAEATLAKDIAQMKNAEAQAARYQYLYKQGVISKDQFEQYSTNAKSMDATVDADRAAVETMKAAAQASQAAVENAKLQLNYSSIRAPISGRTGNLMINEGNLVRANDTVSMVDIYQVTPIYTTFSVPENSFADIRRYFNAGTLTVEAMPNNKDQTELRQQGKLSFLDNEVDRSTGTIQLKAVYPNANSQLWPGQFVNVVVTLTVQPDALVVPSQAVQTGQQGPYVYVVKPDTTVEVRPVAVARTVGSESIISQGLNVNEKVVTDGQLRLTAGSKVKFDNAAPAVAEVKQSQP